MGSAKKLRDEHEDHLRGLVSPGLSSVTQDPTHGGKRRAQHCVVRDEGDEEDVTGDELSNPCEKKRKLTFEQVKYLEMSFNMDLKLEPERKAQIAKKLGIRPRQVAIWFQNRRARWKNKQLEQDFENLKVKYEAELKEKESRMKAHQLIMEENKILQVEVARLKAFLQGAENSVMPNARSDGLVKEEEVSGKSEVASPTKSFEGQSEMQDSGQSYLTPDVAHSFGADSSFELHAPISSNHHKTDYHQSPSFAPFAAMDDIFGSLIQHLQSSGFDLEETTYGHSFSYDDQFHGLAWNTY